MSDDIKDMFNTSAPTARRPLLGLTILVVEDSRFASEAVRLMAQASGARLRRADCLASARRHLQVYRPAVVLVDLGLPDGSGLALIGELTAAAHRPILLATSGDERLERDAMSAGADGFLHKPVRRMAEFQQLVLQNLPDDQRPRGPRCLQDQEINPDPVALRDDLVQISKILSNHDRDGALDYVSQFAGGLALQASDSSLGKASAELRETLGTSAAAPKADALGQIVENRLNRTRAI